MLSNPTVIVLIKGIMVPEMQHCFAGNGASGVDHAVGFGGDNPPGRGLRDLVQYRRAAKSSGAIADLIARGRPRQSGGSYLPQEQSPRCGKAACRKHHNIGRKNAGRGRKSAWSRPSATKACLNGP